MIIGWKFLYEESERFRLARGERELKRNKIFEQDVVKHLTKMVDLWECVCNINGYDPEHMQQYVEAKAFLNKIKGD